jgi:hypothetical protein
MKPGLSHLWPQSLFARLLWVWLLGLALVLAAAAWLALDERMVRGQVVLHAKLTQLTGHLTKALSRLLANTKLL